MEKGNRFRPFRRRRCFPALWLLFSIVQFPFSATAQEVVANQATGRVVILVARDAIFVGVIEDAAEGGSIAPRLLPLSSRRVAVLLGAIEWLQPGSGREPVKLDSELTRVMGELTVQKSLRQEQADDIEALGILLLEPLRNAARLLTSNLELTEDEPIVELLLIGFVEDYGPEVWSVQYRAVQDAVRGEYWQTRVLRPRYNQLYPPEKGQPRTFVEVRFPAEPAEPTLADRIGQNDPRLSRPLTGDAELGKVWQRVAKGESDKVPLKDATQFFRAALDAITPQGAQQAILLLNERSAFQWIIAPQEPVQKAEEESSEEPGRPTLRKKPPE